MVGRRRPAPGIRFDLSPLRARLRSIAHVRRLPIFSCPDKTARWPRRARLLVRHSDSSDDAGHLEQALLRALLLARILA